MDEKLQALAQGVGDALARQGLKISTAESCTGGWVGEVLTSIPGSSGWFERGFVTYSNIAKQEMLGVSIETMERYGVVSEQIVREMAEGALHHSHAQISLAISGIAGPGGAVLDKPVGTVCLAWAGLGLETRSGVMHFQGNREAVRRQAVIASLNGVLDALAEWHAS